MLDATLSREDLAEFAGGFLYGATRQTVDQRTALTGEFWLPEGIEGCYSDDNMEAAGFLESGIAAYQEDDIDKGTKMMIRWLRKVVKHDTVNCDRVDVRRPFKSLRAQVNDYVAQDDYMAIGEARYHEDAYTKGMVDWAYGNFKWSWTIKTYFNAGMFYGQLFDYIVGFVPDYAFPDPESFDPVTPPSPPTPGV